MTYWSAATGAEVDMLHDGACRILNELGMRIEHPQAVEILAGAGAKTVNDHTVRIPRQLVEQSIERSPATFRIFDRQGGSMDVGSGVHLHLPGGTMTEVLEYPGWSRRPATLDDVRQFTRLADALDCIHLGIPMVEGQDAPTGMGEILTCAETLKNTSKFSLACPVEAKANLAFVEMAKAIAGTDNLASRPIIGLLATMLPGYAIDYNATEALLLAAREGLPVVLMGGSISGAQGPATMAGSLVMQAAEQLAALCVVQTVRPGSPCLMNWGQIKLDMRTAEMEEAGPEYPIAMATGAQLSRKWGVPSYACPASDSKIVDFQAGSEFAECMLTALVAGIDVTVNAGTASKCSAASYELLIHHNEMLRNLLRVRRGMIVNDETLAVDTQIEIGIRGDYMTHPHTLQYIHDAEEFLHKDLWDATGIRAPYEDPTARAHARWQDLLRDHEVKVSDADCRAVDAVVAEWDRKTSTS